ncbi:GNAT family N-acetyltransferase [Canibacter sp. lx-72]|uniref:GNAT family N-acetyltransferase n=1 Tax=Canibacter zhuwentaonis TaxID=2837491 RepID=UPI001BDD484E|nr:GNAT family N-acetyltransferase [Canibacter zhuwentaonis]MBT1018339.1 GNAT family N-acetyltransferase [Canibacter zhuwentaonis]
MTDYLRLAELSAATIVEVNSLSLKPGQEQFIAPTSYAAAVLQPKTSWQRVVLRDNKVVGFIHANFDPEATREEFRAALWRINVAADAQGLGIGSYIVKELMAEAQRRGIDRVTVLWERGESSPEKFFLNVGFKPVGETEYGEVIGAYDIPG